MKYGVDTPTQYDLGRINKKLKAAVLCGGRARGARPAGRPAGGLGLGAAWAARPSALAGGGSHPVSTRPESPRSPPPTPSPPAPPSPPHSRPTPEGEDDLMVSRPADPTRCAHWAAAACAASRGRSQQPQLAATAAAVSAGRRGRNQHAKIREGCCRAGAGREAKPTLSAGANHPNRLTQNPKKATAPDVASLREAWNATEVFYKVYPKTAHMVGCRRPTRVAPAPCPAAHRRPPCRAGAVDPARSPRPSRAGLCLGAQAHHEAGHHRRALAERPKGRRLCVSRRRARRQAGAPRPAVPGRPRARAAGAPRAELPRR
jgi:hypothetical protein